MKLRTRALTATLALTAAFTLAACSSQNPLEGDSGSSGGSESASITVGSAAFPENEIIAQIYAQALEAKGLDVSTKMNIGQRAAYLKALEDGSIDLIPEYSGNLLQFYDSDATAQSDDEVVAALKDELPDGLSVLDAAAAQDKDSYNVTREFSQKNGVTSLADLAGLDEELTVAGNPELAQRPYGPSGLEKVYGVKATVLPISDSGGPNTVKALLDGEVQLADVFTTSPLIKEHDLVTLDDPKNLIIAQSVVPLIRTSKADDTVTEVLNAVSSKLTTEALIDMNQKNSGDQKEQPAAIAKQWLQDNGML